MIRTTFEQSGSQSLVAMPYLREREIDGILDAIDSGELIAVADMGDAIASSTIAALARPDVADALTKRGDEAIKQLIEDLQEARREVRSLTDIIGEVFAEDAPSDHAWKIEEAARDVSTQIEYAIDTTETM
jgi:antitoxin (DNA-binding transcriptional repressor) of toxin-antitoxin stability system